MGCGWAKIYLYLLESYLVPEVLICGVADEIHCQQPLNNKHFHAPVTVPLPPRSHRRRIDRDTDSEGLAFRPGVVEGGGGRLVGGLEGVQFSNYCNTGESRRVFISWVQSIVSW